MLIINSSVIYMHFFIIISSACFPLPGSENCLNRKFVEGRILSLSGAPLVTLLTETKVCRKEDRFRHNVCR